MSNDVAVIVWLFTIFFGIVVGDYLVSELKKIKRIKPVNIREMQLNVNDICLRHLNNLDFVLSVQNRTWLDDKQAEEIIKGISLEIYTSMSPNFKEYCYTMVTDGELLAQIGFNVTKYTMSKILTTNKEKKY